MQIETQAYDARTNPNAAPSRDAERNTLNVQPQAKLQFTLAVS